MMNVIFWILVALDAAALGLFLLLGLAAAGPSHTNPLSVVALALVPALLLAGLGVLYLRAPSPVIRIVALAIASAPVVLVAASAVMSQAAAWTLGVPVDVREDPAALREIQQAIARNDAAASAAAVRGDRLAKANLSAGTVLMLALRQLEKTPDRPEVLRALLQEGLRAEAAGNDSPLELAIQLSPRSGPGPVEWLLAAGANPNARATTRPAFFAAVTRSVDPGVLKTLLDHGADLRAVDMAGSNALYWAAYAENWRAAHLLLERGIDWKNVRTIEGLNFLARAEQSRRKGEADGLNEVIRFVKTGAKETPRP